MGVNLGENPQNPVNTPLRFWCQKVLPLVYDDSLSYYELLNKVVVYLNNTITDVGNCEYNITQLLDYYNAIRDYVNQRHALLFCNFDIYPSFVKAGRCSIADTLIPVPTLVGHAVKYPNLS